MFDLLNISHRLHVQRTRDEDTPSSNFTPIMPITTRLGSALLLATCCAVAQAGESFTGKWDIDLRNASERRQNVECGGARFDLTQTEDRISGQHSFATPRCGRLNEGGRVTGVVIANKAVLIVTSARNNAMVLGVATLVRGHLHWESLEEVRPSDTEGDSPLILGEGILKRANE